MKLNSDLGEHEPPERTKALMGLIDLANIACGGHAGTGETMARAVELAAEQKVKIGAHPGLMEDFGRGAVGICEGEMELLIVDQTSVLGEIAAKAGVRLHHIKLHGALYHASEHSEPMAHCYVRLVKSRFPGVKIVALAGGLVVALCRQLGVEPIPEAFAERGYLANGSLVPRGQLGDLITDAALVAERVRMLCRERRVPAVTGELVPVQADTVCVHSDSPNAIEIAQAARQALGPRA